MSSPGRPKGSYRSAQHEGTPVRANRAASIRARLKHRTDISKQDFNLTLLPDGPAPTLHAYPKATVIAEKLHAVTVLGVTNTRMKDFFDL